MLTPHPENVMKKLLIATATMLGLISSAQAQAWVGGAYVVGAPGYVAVNPYAPPVFVAPQPVYSQPAPPTYVVPTPPVVYAAPQPIYAPPPVYVGPDYGGMIVGAAIIGGAAALIASGNNRYYGGGYRHHHRHYRH